MFPKELLSMTEFNQLSLHLAEDHYLAKLIKQKGISSSRKPKHTTNHLVNNSPGSNIIFKDFHLPNAEVECAIVVLRLKAAIDCYESIRSKNERIIEKAPFNQEAAAKTHQ